MIPGLNAAYRRYLYPDGTPPIDFTAPIGEPALVPAGSVSWRVFSNPVSLFVGGVSAVILELALPRVRHGVWDHSTFEAEPRRRLQRTGLAAMVTVYAPRSAAMAMIAGVNRMHEGVRGRTPRGEAYAATDPDLLAWVQATAVFGFAAAYHDLVRPLSPAERDAVFAEGRASATAYGAAGAPTNEAEWQALLDATLPSLEPSATLEAFLRIMAERPVLPLIARPLQGPLVRLAAASLPPGVRGRLALGEAWRPRATDRPLARAAALTASRLALPASPAVQACQRMGVAADVLHPPKDAAVHRRQRRS